MDGYISISMYRHTSFIKVVFTLTNMISKRKLSFSYSWMSTFLLLAGCAGTPTGPGALVMPGQGKTFEQFREDDVACRKFAQGQIENGTQGVAVAGVSSAATGALVGALAGAAIGGRDGAGVGAGAGLVVGSSAGVPISQGVANSLQGRYDNGYIQCMYAKGQKIQLPRSSSIVEAPQGRLSMPITAQPATGGEWIQKTTEH